MMRAVVSDADGSVKLVEGDGVPAATCAQCSAPLTPTQNGGGHCHRHGLQVVEHLQPKELT